MSRSSNPSIANTRFVLPAWWVKAYESSMAQDAGLGGAMELACSSGVVPAMNDVELSALAFILEGLQGQILNGEKLVLRPNDHMKNAGLTVKTKRFAFEKVIQLLSGLRLLASEEASGSYVAQPVFESDRWVLQEEGDHYIELYADSLGKELLLGYVDPAQHILRQLNKLTTTPQFLRNNAPLSLWRSIWLDLKGPEQSLWLRMEQAMQWEYRWLQLDGVVGVPVDQLFDGLKLPELRSDQSSAGDLAKRLKLLSKLGKKLCAHGFLTKAIGDQYLALSTDTDEDDEFSLSLVWQVGRERLMSDASNAYRTGVANYFSKSLSDREVEQLAVVIVGKRNGRASSSVSLYNQLKEIDGLPAPEVMLTNNMPLSAKMLFWEWSLRFSQKSTNWPLPKELMTVEMEDMLTSRIEPLADRFERFCTFLLDHPDIISRIISDAGLSLFSDATQSQDGFANYLDSVESITKESTAGSSATPKPKLVNKPKEVPPSRKAELSGALSAKMMRLASDELGRMRSKCPEQYTSLRNSYLADLSEDDRKMILDMRKLMQMNSFEDHLRKRLVKYMVENPGAWRMPDPSVQFLKDTKSLRIH